MLFVNLIFDPNFFSVVRRSNVDSDTDLFESSTKLFDKNRTRLWMV